MYCKLFEKPIVNIAGESSIHERRENLHFVKIAVNKTSSLHRITTTTTTLLLRLTTWLIVTEIICAGRKTFLHFGLNGVNETYPYCATDKNVEKTDQNLLLGMYVKK